MVSVQTTPREPTAKKADPERGEVAGSEAKAVQPCDCYEASAMLARISELESALTAARADVARVEAEAYARGRADERSAVVDYIENMGSFMLSARDARIFESVFGGIERGEHVKGEKT